MMINLLVVEGRRERRAHMVDALCELVGVEVRATAADAAGAMSALDAGVAFDAIVTTGDGATGSLIEAARDRGIRDVIVLGGLDVAEHRDRWLELGACRVVDNVPALIACAAGLVDARTRTLDRTRRLDHEVATAPPVRRSVSRIATATGSVQDIRIRQLLHSMLVRFGASIPPEVQVVLECAPGLPPVRCNPHDLERLIFHLVLDASEAIPLGGKIWVVVERVDTHHVSIEVIDSGGSARELAAGTSELVAAVADRGADVRLIGHDGGATSVQVVLPTIIDALN